MALVQSENEAADELLLEGLRLGAEVEQMVVIKAIFQRKRIRGLSGVVEQYESLSQRLQQFVMANIHLLHHALRECGRSDRQEVRQAAMRMIAISRQCKLAYVLTENLHDSDETLSKTAAEAIVALGAVGVNQHAADAAELHSGAETSAGDDRSETIPGERPCRRRHNRSRRERRSIAA